MLRDARWNQIALGDDRMNYVEFGRGERVLVMIPGLSDGFAPVSGRVQAAGLAVSFRQLGKDFRVLLFSGKNCPEPGLSTRDMARDLAAALNTLGIQSADVLGVSMGGMIAQHLAADCPGLVNRLVLAVSAPAVNEPIREAVQVWTALARQGKHRALMADTAERSYSEDYLLKYRLLYPVLGLTKPKTYRRFLIQAAACLGHDASDRLRRIQCPTLVIGGGEDRIVGPDAAQKLAEGIPGSRLYVYKGLGHAAYQEAPDFQMRIKKFLLR